MQILNALTCEVLEHGGSFQTPSDQIQYIAQTLKDSECVHVLSVLSLFDSSCFELKCLPAGPDLHVYLLIHNIDGLMLRGEKTQSALGLLASLPNLHLVASIDHINAPLGECFYVCSPLLIYWNASLSLNPVYFPVWDQFQQSQFNWLWWECVTFQHYVEETSYENSLLVQQTGALALASLTHVLRSLTPNARYRAHLEYPTYQSHWT